MQEAAVAMLRLASTLVGREWRRQGQKGGLCTRCFTVPQVWGILDYSQSTSFLLPPSRRWPPLWVCCPVILGLSVWKQSNLFLMAWALSRGVPGCGSCTCSVVEHVAHAWRTLRTCCAPWLWSMHSSCGRAHCMCLSHTRDVLSTYHEWVWCILMSSM